MIEGMKELREEYDALMKAAGSTLTQESWERMEAIRTEMKRLAIDSHAAKGEYSAALTCCSSNEVAGWIVEFAPLMTDAELKETLLSEWTRCEAHRPYRDEFIELFERVGFVTDAEKLPNRLKGKTVTLYRGNLGEDEPVGIAWTLNRKTAEFFGRYGMTLRGQILGLHRPDGVPTVWKAKADVADVLAYFEGRNEAEVLIDPMNLRDVHMVAQAVPQKPQPQQIPTEMAVAP